MEVCPQPCPAPADTAWLILHLFSLPLTTGFSPQVLPHPTEKLCTALRPECSQVQHGLPEGVRGEHCPGQGAGSPATATRAVGAWGAAAQLLRLGDTLKVPPQWAPYPSFPVPVAGHPQESPDLPEPPLLTASTSLFHSDPPRGCQGGSQLCNTIFRQPADAALSQHPAM